MAADAPIARTATSTDSTDLAALGAGSPIRLANLANGVGATQANAIAIGRNAVSR